MEPYKKSDYWFESAEYDLRTAKAMLETKRYLYVYVPPNDRKSAEGYFRN